MNKFFKLLLFLLNSHLFIAKLDFFRNVISLGLIIFIIQNDNNKNQKFILIFFFDFIFIIVFYFMLLLIIYSYFFFFTETINVPDFKLKSTRFVPPTDKGYDQCRFFKIKNDSIYRMGQSNIIGKWDVYNTSLYLEQNRYYSADWFPNITNLGLSWTTDQITAIYYNSTRFDVINSINLSVVRSQPEMNTSLILKGIATSSNMFYLLLNKRNNISNNLYMYYKNMTYVMGYINVVQNQANLTISRDGKNLFIWTNTSNIDAGAPSSSTINFIYRNVDPTYQRNNTLNDIEFSLDGKLAVFQYDDKYPLTVFNLTSYTVIMTKNFTTIINQVIFLDGGTLLGVCLNYSHMEVYDIATLTLQKTVLFNTISNYSAIHYQTQTLYQCLRGNISVTQMICPPLTYYDLSTYTCIGCNLPQNCTQCDAKTGECSACSGKLTAVNGTCVLIQSNFTIILSNQTQHPIPIYDFGFLQGVTQHVTQNAGIISVVMLSIQMSPFSMVFIQFITFWNICCLYSMINLQNSLSIPLMLKQIYKIVQSSLFQFLGINFNYNPLSNKDISSQYPNFYNVSYDVINSNLQNLALMGILFIFILIAKIIKKTTFYNVSLIKYVLTFSRTQAVLGQFISFIPMSILSFKSFIHSAESLNFSQKLNNILFVFLVFLFIISPFYILIHYYSKIVKLCGELNKFQSSKIKQRIMGQKDIFEYAKKQKFITNTKKWLIPPQAQYRFLNAFVNLSVPILIILPYNQPFFILSTFIYGYQVHVATKLSHYKIMSIILSSIFLNFHLLYLICYLSSDFAIVFQFASLICFTILVIGGLIELSSVVLICLYEILVYLKKIFKTIKISYPFKLKGKQENIFQRQDHFGKKKCVKVIDSKIQNNQQIQIKKIIFKQQIKLQETNARKKFKIKHFKKKPNQALRFDQLCQVNQPESFISPQNSIRKKDSLQLDIYSQILGIKQSRKTNQKDRLKYNNSQMHNCDYEFIYCEKIKKDKTK